MSSRFLVVALAADPVPRLAGILAETDAEYAVVVSDDTRLADHAIAALDAAVDENMDADLLYGDETVMQDGEETLRISPEWSPERLRHHLSLGGVVVVRVDAVRRFTALEPWVELHDLVLQLAEGAPKVVHLREPLSSRLAADLRTVDSTPAALYAWEAQVRAVRAHLARLGVEGFVARGHRPGFTAVLRALDTAVSLSVIIATYGVRGRVRGVERYHVVEAVQSVLESTTVADLQVIVVHSPSIPAGALEQLRAFNDDRVLLTEARPGDGKSAMNNAGFLLAHGEYVAFLHDDTEVITDQALVELIAPLRESGIAITGARLLAESMFHNHAGVRYGDGTVRAGGTKLASNDDGSAGMLRVDREVSALTGVVALRRGVFERVGGFSEDFPEYLGDIDLSLKVRADGLRAVWVHSACLLHFDVDSVAEDDPEYVAELALLVSRWGPIDGPDEFGVGE